MTDKEVIMGQMAKIADRLRQENLSAKTIELLNQRMREYRNQLRELQSVVVN